MKNSRVLLLAVAAFGFLPLCSEAGLVIEQDQKMTGQGMNMELKSRISFDGTGKLRMATGDMSVVLFDSSKDDIITLVPAQKMAMKMNKAMMKDLQAKMQAKPAEGAIKVSATGKKETIAGLAAVEVSIESPEMNGTLWIAKDFPQAKEIKAMMLKMGEGMKSGPDSNKDMFLALEKQGLDGYPVKMDVTMKQGGGEMKLTSVLTKVEEQDVDVAQFEVPAGYKVQDMAVMLRGAGQGAGKGPATGEDADSDKPE